MKICQLYPGCTVAGLAGEIRRFLREDEHMETRCYKLCDGSYIIQGRIVSGQTRQLVGLDKAVTVTLSPREGRRIGIALGRGRWLDKCLTAGVSLAALWPLALTAAAGAYQQHSLMGRLRDVIKKMTAPV